MGTNTVHEGMWCAELSAQKRETGSFTRVLMPALFSSVNMSSRRSFEMPGNSTELGWEPRHNVEQGLAATVDWYLDHLPWCQTVCARAGYQGERIGVAAI